MTWATIIPLITKYGLQWAYDFWNIIKTSGTPTDEQWAALLELNKKTLAQYVDEAGLAGGVTPPPPPA